ncbi:MAG: hypothetical protein IKY84_06175, partial [Bacteroidaceae bacterium]|nr:hypothetical protein [Bacteroidaceae bacterium]
LQVIVNVNVIVAAIGCHRQPIYKHLSPENSPLGMKTPFRGAKLAMRITTSKLWELHSSHNLLFTFVLLFTAKHKDSFRYR